MRLESEPDLDVIAEAANGQAAVDLATRLEPSVVLMDVEMPLMDGIKATQRICVQAPGTAVIVLSLHDDPMTIGKAKSAGAVAFVAKHQTSTELIAAIRSAAGKRGILNDKGPTATNSSEETQDTQEAN